MARGDEVASAHRRRGRVMIPAGTVLVDADTYHALVAEMELARQAIIDVGRMPLWRTLKMPGSLSRYTRHYLEVVDGTQS